MTEELLTKGTLAKNAAFKLACTDSETKNRALEAIADALLAHTDEIIAENKKDIAAAEKKGIKKAMIDRLALSKERIKDISDGVKKVIELPNPIGKTVKEWERPNGLVIAEKRVPIGVIAIIYEARPNVTVDAAVLCLKSSNAVILRGGSEAVNSNIILMKIMQDAAYKAGVPEGCLNLIEDTNRGTAVELMKMNGFIDLLIPRGGAALIRSVVENATVPVIETAAGNCHVYADKDCDFDMALSIILNSKVSRPSVCNAAETLLIDREIAENFLPIAVNALKKAGVEVRGCPECVKIMPDINSADESDWRTEYNDYIMAVKIVGGVSEAIEHINKYNTKHSEAIITNNSKTAEKFLNEVDAAAVYVNASTRFTDGFEFGFGAEIGISTQKMHARGPMGLEQLTSIKYVIRGNGQIRE
jgi:glutamate-5-semialdehyde dehydrogenase